MPDFNIETRDPVDIDFNHLEFAGELTLLDEVYDAALLKFEWGETDDLEEGETPHEEDGGIFTASGSVEDESFTADVGEWVNLDNQSLKAFHEEVTTTDGETTFVRGEEEDYEMDYNEGKIKVLSDGDMSDGTEYHISYDYGYSSVLVDDLEEDTEYFFRAVAESVAYDSEAAMDNAVGSGGFMGGLANNKTEMNKATDSETAMNKVTDSEIAMNKVTDSEIAMDKVTDKEMPMDKVTDKEMPMDKVTDKEVAMNKMIEQLTKGMPGIKFFGSPYLNDTMWSKEMASEKFWKSGTPDEFPDGISYDDEEDHGTLDIEVEDNRTILYLVCPESVGDVSSDRGYIWKVDMDFSSVNKLKLKAKFTDDVGGGYRILIDETEIFYEDSSHSWKEIELEVDGYSGVKTLTIDADSGSNGHNEYWWADINLD